MELTNYATIPRSEKIQGKADGPAALAVGEAVRITASKIGGRYQVALADPASASGVPAVGVVIKKTGSDYVIQFAGPVTGVYTGLTPNEVYFLGADGALAADGDANFPTAGGTVHFQQLGVATSSDELLLQPLGSALGSPSGDGRYFNQVVTGVINGVNLVFTTSLFFVAVGPRAQTLRVNGVVQEVGVGCDYVVSESGGAGTGFDTLTLAYPPYGDDVLRIDFDPDL